MYKSVKMYFYFWRNISINCIHRVVFMSETWYRRL